MEINTFFAKLNIVNILHLHSKLLLINLNKPRHFQFSHARLYIKHMDYAEDMKIWWVPPKMFSSILGRLEKSNFIETISKSNNWDFVSSN